MRRIKAVLNVVGSRFSEEDAAFGECASCHPARTAPPHLDHSNHGRTGARGKGVTEIGNQACPVFSVALEFFLYIIFALFAFVVFFVTPWMDICELG